MYLTCSKPPFLSAVFLASFALLGVARPQMRETETNLFDPCEQAPTRYFDFTITWDQNAPDGVKRNMFVINGQFPGPKIELTEGESVVVKLKNSSPFNTTIHYHGTSLSQISHDKRRTLF
jgi:FtsP/CotA-like multicopper oxidase with cupredoxin domain